YLTSPVSLSLFFNPTPTTEIYTLSLHDALPIFSTRFPRLEDIDPVSGRRDKYFKVRYLLYFFQRMYCDQLNVVPIKLNRILIYRSEEHRLNSSHRTISYAVFCLKKKNINSNILT